MKRDLRFRPAKEDFAGSHFAVLRGATDLCAGAHEAIWGGWGFCSYGKEPQKNVIPNKSKQKRVYKLKF